LPNYGTEIILRVIPGPQDDHFTPAGIGTFFDSSYTVTSRNDRMGVTFEGPVIEHLKGPDIVSDAVYPGAIQVPGRGMPIVMMMDCQTTGGYPKIGTVIGPDLRRLAQARAGNKVRFIRCSDAEAVTLLKEEQQHYSEFAALMALHMG
jgi:allophanate hydrolase subunit 2